MGEFKTGFTNYFPLPGSTGVTPVATREGRGEGGAKRHNYLAVDFTTSLGLKLPPWTNFPMAASTPKSSEIFDIPFIWPVVHPREIFVAGGMISFSGS